MIRTVAALTLIVGATACAPPPPPQVTPAAPPAVSLVWQPSFAEKQAWILWLEDQRILRDTSPPGATTPPDLVSLLGDPDARIRRRAALATGRVGLKDGVEPLVQLLSDPEPEVRQMAAFSLGLIGDVGARDGLVAALGDGAPAVRASAAEALGFLGDASVAPAIARMAADVAQSGVLADPGADIDDRRDAPAAPFRLAVFALARLKAYEPLASVVLDEAGQPRYRTWPVAFALQRIEDARALPALLTLSESSDSYTKAFAAKGLGGLKDRKAVPALIAVAAGRDRNAAVEAIRALGRIGDSTASPLLVRIIQEPKPDAVLRLEAFAALGTVGGSDAMDVLLDSIADPSPAVRAAILRSIAQRDPPSFMTVMSGLDTDPSVAVRGAIASIFGTLPVEMAFPRLRAMLNDPDLRVIPPVLASIGKLQAPEAAALLLERLKADDAVIRAAAANALAELKPPNAAPALAEAYRTGESDSTYVARAAALVALRTYGAADAVPVLTEALRDRDWAVRVRAVQLLKELDPATDADLRSRPAPTRLPRDVFGMERLINPRVSTQAFIETDAGVIQLELAVIDAPATVDNFVTLARKGFYDGVTFHRVVSDFVVQGGDPRGDGEGGPGYTIRDEPSERSYLRGVVGMALDWEDTGGSQFFITHSPQPHLDGRYTIFGRVIGGMEFVDRIQQGDAIRRVTIWDGT